MLKLKTRDRNSNNNNDDDDFVGQLKLILNKKKYLPKIMKKE